MAPLVFKVLMLLCEPKWVLFPAAWFLFTLVPPIQFVLEISHWICLNSNSDPIPADSSMRIKMWGFQEHDVKELSEKYLSVFIINNNNCWK